MQPSINKQENKNKKKKRELEIKVKKYQLNKKALSNAKTNNNNYLK